MEKLRLRFKLNPGRHGAPLDKLGEFSSQCERFLRSLSHDLGLETHKGEWLAQNFSNGSVQYDAILAESVPDTVIARGNLALNGLGDNDPVGLCNRGVIGFGTLAEFAKIGKVLDPDESYYIHIYDPNSPNPINHTWKEISYRKSAEIRQLLNAPVYTFGSIQAAAYSWTSGGQTPFFNVRSLTDGALVKCIYGSSVFHKVHEAFARPNNILIVYGDISWDRPTSAVLEMRVNDIEVTKPLSEFDFARIFGSIPDFTNDLSTSDYIDWVRGDAE